MAFNLNYNDYITVEVNINNRTQICNFLVDTQADVCVIRQASIPYDTFLNTAKIINIRGITNDSLQSFGTTDIGLYMANDFIIHEFHVVPDDFNIYCDGIVGKDLLIAYKCNIDYSNMTVSIRSVRTASILKITNGPNENVITVPPRSESVRQFRINAIGDCVVDHTTLMPGVYLPRTIVNPNDALIRVINTTDRPQTIPKLITNHEPLENFYCYTADETKSDHE